MQNGYFHAALINANQGYKIDKVVERSYTPFVRWYIYWEKLHDNKDYNAIDVGPNVDPLLDWWVASRTRPSIFLKIYPKTNGGFGSFQMKFPGFGIRVAYGTWHQIMGSPDPEYWDNGARCYEMHTSGWLLGSIGLILLLLLKKRRRTCLTGCPACGYDLRGTPERCPECGRETSAAEREKILAVLQKSDAQ